MPQTELIIIVIVVTIFSRSDVIASTYNVKSKNSFQRKKRSVFSDFHKIYHVLLIICIICNIPIKFGKKLKNYYHCNTILYIYDNIL